MSQQKRNPKIEWGFFAVVPRIVRTQYKELTHSDKWLYTCLKDLCGDKGTCFRTLRSLKEETDISIASLSTMIPKLHDAGLIHAEKKRRSNSGKEVWHISIVDIWQSNKDFCSKIEQSPDEVVQNLNNNVQYLNKEAEVCSNIERDCSNFGYRRTTLEEQHIEERTIEEESIASFGNDAAPASLIDFTEEKKKRTDPGLPVVQVTTDTVSHSYSTHDYGNAEDEDDTPTEKVPVVKPSRQPVGAVLTEEQLDEAYDAYIAPSKQPASGLRITHAPTSKAMTQERMPEPAPPTDKQLKQQQSRRENELWAIVERKLETTFSRTQRKSAKNKCGMERLLEDEITDEKIELALSRLSEWEINNFDLERFHELLPGKTAKHRSSQQNGKAPPTASKKSADVNDYSITALLKRQAAAQG